MTPSERERFRGVVDEIAGRYGPVIDLRKSPAVMLEILREFGHVLDDEGGGGGGGGVGPGVSTIAVGITPPESREDIQLVDVMKAVLSLQRDVSRMGARLDSVAQRLSR